MIDFLYSWIRNRQLLDCKDYSRIIQRQRQLLDVNKEEYEQGNKDVDLRTLIASANLYATYLFKDNQFDLANTVATKILDFCNKNLANHEDIKHETVNTMFVLGDISYKIADGKKAKEQYNEIIKFIGSDEKYNATKQGQLDIYDAYISALSANHLDSDTPGDIENIHNQLMEAHKIALDIVEFYDDIQSKRYLMMSYLRLGNFYLNKNSPMQAQTLYRQADDLALEIYQTTNDELDHLYLLHCDLAPISIHLSNGNIKEAEEILNTAIDRLNRMKQEHMFMPTINLLLIALSNLMIVKLRQNNHDEAVRYALDTKLLAREAKNNWDCPEQKIIYARALMQYGNVIENENIEKTISDFVKAITYVTPYINRRDLKDASRTYINANIHLASIFQSRDENEKAITCIEAAVKAQELVVKEIENLDTLRALSDIYECARFTYTFAKLKDEAIKYAQKSLDMGQKVIQNSHFLSDIFNFTKILGEVGTTYAKFDEVEQAYGYFQDSLQLINQVLSQRPNDIKFLQMKQRMYAYIGQLGIDNKNSDYIRESLVGQKDAFKALHEATKEEQYLEYYDQICQALGEN